MKEEFVSISKDILFDNYQNVPEIRKVLSDEDYKLFEKIFVETLNRVKSVEEDVVHDRYLLESLYSLKEAEGTVYELQETLSSIFEQGQKTSQELIDFAGMSVIR